MSLFRELSYQADITPVRSVQFALLGPEEILKRSVVEVRSTESFNGSVQIPNGLFDQRMGVVEHGKFCQTCQQGYTFCPGHIGHIELAHPVFHIHFFKTVVYVLKCVCWRCSKLLVHPDAPEMAALRRLHRQKRWDAVKNMLSKSGAARRCSREDGCGALQPSRTCKHDDKFLKCELSWDAADGEDVPSKITLGADDVLRILQRVPDADVAAMGFHPKYSRPEWMLATVLPVPPPSVRPSAKNDMGQRSEDDLTTVLCNIVKTNNALAARKQAGKQIDATDQQLQLLQYYVATMVDNTIPNMSPATQRTGRSIKSISERLKGKEGRVRGNLLGKRVDYSARSVITPDPNISVNELGVPLRIAMNLTFPETVTPRNRARLADAVGNGPTVYPGARFVQKSGDDMRTVQLRAGRAPPDLETGDVVHRHMRDGDYVLFNRQPSLHKMSMMAHKVRVMEHNTFRLNAMVTPAYNADFDGDEMNLHMPISAFSMAEIALLAAVPMHVLSPKKSSPIMAVVQDVALGVHVITLPGVRIDARNMMNLMASLPRFDGRVPKPLDAVAGAWSGRQALSAVIPATVNATLKAAGDKVRVTRGQLGEEGGALTKGAFQSDTKGLVHAVYNELGPRALTDMMDGTQRLVCEWLLQSGFSVGLSDLAVDAGTLKEIDGKLQEAERGVSDLIAKIHGKGWKPKASLNTPAEDLENEINSRLNGTTKELEQTIPERISPGNRIMRMVTAGSKGNKTNMVQMTATLGQQNVDQKRPGYGFEGRTLPHYSKYDDGPQARGFVRNSFASGLNPSEFIFHSMGGRVGLIDTAVRTSESGYISRKLVKAMEDCKVATDGTVRNALGQVVQVIYGEDGMDTVSIETQELFHLDYDGDKMADAFLVVEGDPCLEALLGTEALADFASNPQWQRFKDHFWRVMRDRTDVVMYMRGGRVDVSKQKDVSFPVNLARVVGDAMDLQRATVPRGWPSDLDPRAVLDEIDAMQRDLVPHRAVAQCPVFGALLRAYLSPKRLLQEGMLRATFLRVCADIRDRFEDALAQPGDMVGIVSAQSLGEPTTQLTLNSVARDTEMLVCQDGAVKTVRIGDLVDPYLPEIEDPLHQNDYVEVDNLRCVSLSDREKARWSRVTHVSRHPSHNQMITVKTESGRRVTATRGHSFLTRKDNRVARVLGSRLRPGDALPIVKDLPAIDPGTAAVPDAPLPLTFAAGRLVGAAISDGGRVDGAAVSFEHDDEGWVRSVVDGFNADGGRRPAAQAAPVPDRFRRGNVLHRGRVDHAPLAAWIREHFDGALPGWILAAPREFARGLLQAAFDADGCLDARAPGMRYYTESGRLGTAMAMALASFGVATHAGVVNTSGGGWKRRRCHKVAVPAAMMGTFEANIGLAAARKRDLLRAAVERAVPGASAAKPIPGLGPQIDALCRAAEASGGASRAHRAMLHGARASGRLQPAALDELRAAAAAEWGADRGLLAELEQAAAADCFWDPITEIAAAPAEGEMVYDLTVDGDHTFVDSSLLAHRNTFHLAGVASGSKAVSGLPRVMELLNVTANPKRSLIYVHLPPDMRFSSEAATQMKARIETAKLSDVVSRSRIYFDPDDTRVEEDRSLVEAYRALVPDGAERAAASPWVIRLELDRGQMLEHNVTMLDVSESLSRFYRETASCMHSDDNSEKLVFRVRLHPQSSGDLLTEIRAFEAAMMEAVNLKNSIGITTAMPMQPLAVQEHEFDGATGRFVPVADAAQKEWVLETDGRDLSEVLASPLVDPRRTHSNDICETLRVLGVEAARQKLYDELQEVLKESDINPRHLLLLVDVMTLGGGLQSINRHGINRGDIGPLAKCSFEETTEMLTNAAMFADVDRVNGVSASIMLGQVPPGGTGGVHPLLDDSLLTEEVFVEHPQSAEEDTAARRADREEMCRRILRFAPIDFGVNDGWSEPVRVAARLAGRRERREKSIHVAVASAAGGEVVAIATNDREDGHAECRLLREVEKAPPAAGPLDVLVVRVTNTSTRDTVAFANSRPCRACREALLRTGAPVRTVSWSTGDGMIFVARREDL
eukprot:jgi/Tetstr1/464173/TSEL_008978.t1